MRRMTPGAVFNSFLGILDLKLGVYRCNPDAQADIQAARLCFCSACVDPYPTRRTKLTYS